MTSVTQAFMDNKLLNNILYQIPTITAYNRMETRARSEDFEKSLRAEIMDGLWMLTRQWQLGEFDAHDGGSAIDARLLVKTTEIDRITISGKTSIYDDSVPLETMLETELLTRPYPLSLKIQMGQYFIRQHSKALKGIYMSQYLHVYGLDTGMETQLEGRKESLQLYLAMRTRAIDGEKLESDILDGTFAAKITFLSPADKSTISGYGDELTAWMKRIYYQPETANKAWNSQKLEYACTLSAPDTEQTEKKLTLHEYYSGRLDWFAFNQEIQNNDPSGAVAGEGPRSEPREKVTSFIPTPAIFKGMPSPRFWEMEDRQIDFGKLNAKTTDHLLLEFSEFALVYSNDWFILPYKLRHNSISEIRGLVVTDTFGDRTWIESANGGSDNQWQNWRVFGLSNEKGGVAAGQQFFFPSTIGSVLESAPIEQVNFIHDEMANMVWAIENIVPDQNGLGIDGNLVAATQPLPAPISGSTASIQYVLGNAVPENWIPFLPVHKPGSNQEIYFQRASFPKLGVPPKDVIKAKGVFLNEVEPPYYVNEEEIPNSGTIITRRYIRTRWMDGRTFLWIGRKKENGKGSGRSNLAFDQIVPIP